MYNRQIKKCRECDKVIEFEDSSNKKYNENLHEIQVKGFCSARCKREWEDNYDNRH